MVDQDHSAYSRHEHVASTTAFSSEHIGDRKRSQKGQQVSSMAALSHVPRVTGKQRG